MKWRFGRSREILIMLKQLFVDKRWAQIWYPLRWRMGGFDFGSVAIEELNLDPDRANAHHNSGGPDLARVLRMIGVPQGSRILDFGSGKGGAVMTMAAFPFDELVGVELSRELISIAETNCRRMGGQKVHFVERDAALFTDLDRFTHIYMYHPFPCPIVEAVCENLKASLLRHERRLTLIYKNPVCHEAVMKNGVFRVERDMRFAEMAPDWDRFRIYVHESLRL